MTVAHLTARLAVLGVLAAPVPAQADVTAFLGVSTTPGLRSARGAAAGAGLVVVAFEFEAAQIAEQARDGEPGLTTGMANVLLQTPLDISGVQFYGTAGVGLYRERLEARRETHAAVNLGGGIKVGIAGPLKLRLDYRLLRLQGTPLHAVYHRVYAGATLGF